MLTNCSKSQNLLTSKIKAYAQLMRLNKPIGIGLLLWPTLWALWLVAHGMPPISILIIFVLGVLVMRPAGCIINDLADRNFDGKVARTQQRPLATGTVRISEAIILFLILCSLGLVLVWQLNLFTILLAAIALILSCIYPLMKRYIAFPQLILGMAWYLAIPMAFAAVTGSVSGLGWLLYITVVIWTVIFDTMYAMADREDDLKLGLKSTAILFGQSDRKIIGFLQLCFLGLLCTIGYLAKLNYYYFIACGISAMLMLYHQYLIKDRDASHCLQAFKHNQWIGMIMFVGIFLA